jgi:hypothetical protein
MYMHVTLQVAGAVIFEAKVPSRQELISLLVRSAAGASRVTSRRRRKSCGGLTRRARANEEGGDRR